MYKRQTESIHLQGRFDTYPKRRGLTRVTEIDRAGMNVCFGQDSIVDPWYPLGNGNILRILEAGLHICHMLGYEDLKRSLDPVSYTHLAVYKRQQIKECPCPR